MASDMTRADLKKRLKEMATRRARIVSPFNDDSPEERQERREKCASDIFTFARHYLPHYFTDATPDFHKEWVRLAEQTNRFVLIAAPRGHAKSSIFTLLLTLHWTLFARHRFIIIGSDTDTQARTLLSFVRAELEDNLRLTTDFGVQKGSRSWSESDLITTGDIRLTARGKGQSMRGLRHGAYRPDAFVGDDLENDAEQNNPDRVSKTIDWLKRVVVPCLNPKAYSLIVAGTILSRRSALNRLMQEKTGDGAPLHVTARYQALDPGGVPLWPERFSAETLKRLKRQIGARAFNAEYQNDPHDDESGVNHRWIVDWRDRPAHEPVTAFSIYTDPSVGETTRHDYKATIAIVRRGTHSDVVAARIRRESFSLMIAAIFDMYEELRDAHPTARALVGFESNGFQVTLKSAYEAEEIKRGIHLPLTLINNRTAKTLRVESLCSPIERGLIRFRPEEPDQETLIEQLLYFGRPGVHDDGPDALEGAVRLLNRVVGGGPLHQPRTRPQRRRSLPLPQSARGEL